MMSWSNWASLKNENVKGVPENTKGVYAIRVIQKPADGSSDIIYIGCAGKGEKAGVSERLIDLIRGLNRCDKGKSNHCAAPKIKKFQEKELEFSWFKTFQVPDAVEKSLLIAFWLSTGKLPECNGAF